MPSASATLAMMVTLAGEMANTVPLVAAVMATVGAVFKALKLPKFGVPLNQFVVGVASMVTGYSDCPVAGAGTKALALGQSPTDVASAVRPRWQPGRISSR